METKAERDLEEAFGRLDASFMYEYEPPAAIELDTRHPARGRQATETRRKRLKYHLKNLEAEQCARQEKRKEQKRTSTAVSRQHASTVLSRVYEMTEVCAPCTVQPGMGGCMQLELAATLYDVEKKPYDHQEQLQRP